MNDSKQSSLKKLKIEMKAFDFIEQSQEYLNYLKAHISNVQTAFFLVDLKCRDMDFIWDDYKWHCLKASVESHDLSKFSVEEFVQYRQKFYPTEIEKNQQLKSHFYPKSVNSEDINSRFDEAWEHHILNNQHHWQNWYEGKSDIEQYYYYQVIECVHMVIDWIAMGLAFNNSAKDYYEKNKSKINIPDWADKLVLEICDRIYPITPEDLEWCAR